MYRPPVTSSTLPVTYFDHRERERERGRDRHTDTHRKKRNGKEEDDPSKK
jgi:hypothetical protein